MQNPCQLRKMTTVCLWKVLWLIFKLIKAFIVFRKIYEGCQQYASVLQLVSDLQKFEDDNWMSKKVQAKYFHPPFEVDETTVIVSALYKQKRFSNRLYCTTANRNLY